jgi:TetR/AcrR family transcriptional regulator
MDQHSELTSEEKTADGGQRRKPGARRLQILQTLAAMLEDPKGEKVTTAALAAKLHVSEAALYRHFASKAQMFEGLIEFIESTIFGLINEISAQEQSGVRQVRRMVQMLLEFAQTNRGMTRVLIGDALVNENERLQERMNQLLERIETSLKQGYRVAATQQELPADTDAAARSAVAVAYVVGRWHRFAKSGFRRAPADGLDAHWGALL